MKATSPNTTRRTTSEGAAAGNWFQRMPYPAFLLTAALTASLMNLFFFCPRFALWRGLDLPMPRVDIDRAVDTLAQVEDPFVRIENRYNRVIQWRLLFPLVGHWLRLPPKLFLALPHVGCLAALALIAHVAFRELQQRMLAFVTTALAAGCAWFFVSTGWLAYNDSWTILGLVAVAFLRSRIVLGAAVLLCPWIDERFLMLLPVCLALRSYLLHDDESFRPLLIDAGVATAAALPYLITRLIAYFSGNDPVTDAYVQQTSKESLLPWHVVLGSWMGMRGMWVYVGAFCWLACRRRGAGWNALVLAGTAVVFLASLFVAHDISRSVSVFLPVGLAGVVLLHRHAPQRLAGTLPWVLVANLLLPASHVTGSFKLPILYFYSELERWFSPPDYLTPDYYNNRGLALLQQNQPEQAWEEFETALKLDASFAPARGNKALILTGRREYELAIQELNAVVASGVNLPDALHLRGNCFEALGRREAAAEDYQQALALAPEDWPSRGEVQQRLRRLGRTVP
jgi:Tfp pilus assembly protein PilF